MPRYDYYPEDEDNGYDDSARRSMRSSLRMGITATTKSHKLEYVYGIQRNLSEPHRQLVAAAINATLAAADQPLQKFKPNPDEMPATILSTASSAAVFLSQHPGMTGANRLSNRDFNQRITELVDHTNQQRPAILAAAQSVNSMPILNNRIQRTNYGAVVRLAGEGAQAINDETDQIRSELTAPEVARNLPFFIVGMNTSLEATDSFVEAMHQGRLVHNIMTALRSDANPEGLLEFGPLETMTP